MSLTIVTCGGAALAKQPFELERHVEPGSGVCVVHGEAMPVVREAFRQENRALCPQIGRRDHPEAAGGHARGARGRAGRRRRDHGRGITFLIEELSLYFLKSCR
jgi:hypothetical protein